MTYIFVALILVALSGIALLLLKNTKYGDRLPQIDIKKGLKAVKKFFGKTYTKSLATTRNKVQDFIQDKKTQSERKEALEDKESLVHHIKTKRVKKKKLPDFLNNSEKEEVEKNEDYWIERIQKHPEDAEAYKKLGEWYMKNGPNKYAIKTLEHAQKLRPDDEEIKKYLKRLK